MKTDTGDVVNYLTNSPRRILIIQLRRIGDVIVTTPVIDALRARFPEARLEFLVEPAAAPVVAGYPGLDESLVFDKSRYWYWLRDIRARRYDWVLDFMNNPGGVRGSLLERGLYPPGSPSGPPPLRGSKQIRDPPATGSASAGEGAPASVDGGVRFRRGQGLVESDRVGPRGDPPGVHAEASA